MTRRLPRSTGPATRRCSCSRARSARTGRSGMPSCPSLAERFRVLRYDHRGHGALAGSATARYTVESLADGVLELLDALELERVSFCGLSLGGMVGMWLARRAPERIDRLVLCCTAARLGPPERWDERAAIVRAEGVEAIADAVLGRWFTPRSATRARDVSRASARCSRRRPPRATRPAARRSPLGPRVRLGAHPAPDARDRRRRRRRGRRPRTASVAGGDPRRRARRCSRTPRTSRTSSSPTPSPSAARAPGPGRRTEAT